MKAIRLHDRSGPAGVVYEDAPIPEPRAGDALVRLRATGITPAELTWSETYEHADGSSRVPSIPGHEICGVVEAVAPGVDSVAIGDEVYGLTSFVRDGGAAEYVATAAADLAPKPRTTDFVQSAAVPLSALTVWQAFFDHAKLSTGQCVLIHGGAGGVRIAGISGGVDVKPQYPTLPKHETPPFLRARQDTFFAVTPSRRVGMH
jgi:NADPH:quinone reductase-like Zn-dependent oxidoreductase